MLSLLGTSYLNQALSGKLCVGHLLPYCRELVEGGFVQRLDGVTLRTVEKKAGSAELVVVK
ncbi:MAG: hypothetical protein KatS3mg023_3925 [Armatimonadota bacterium]|nr:MAG: hypothetical protein KatS3mg023_3925 [Armatimonadota bacterium]